ncbi:iron ABC transporter permease [Sulfitobacter mediterraneus]|uniref:ABC transporter permease n=1 Tax=Sulfitobacter mediterraneus TaxID=83219 RepID=UPI00193335AE|nr:iron ABC transporter permease [Sulfitobacter mediterraneus]MBM1632604.1 iron ABC transporter permease [Sulfitobacter mediterraneus]MBM1641262.1 iron ABC transporter permease [Sulfitobacter mediterraneus]MBM1644469.1 iron ABC transporter permease [Sulfitobacter mediterraneus]MBM1649382.1 iron ABC transporter permease [Sulfitobacter mediterraneus]MBM1653403.1 iron ABC transporter permease [Sulfitobacter mediterraneus]
MTLNPTQTAARTAPRDGIRVLSFVSVLVAVICALPMLAVLIAALSGGTDTVAHLIDTVLGRYAATTLLLVLLVSIGTFAIGVGAAWLVTMTRFPAVKILEIALVLPLAFPAYVLAYAYTHVLDHPGIVQASLRDLTGWGPRDYWFPEIRSLGGAAAMLVLVLYPYVYLLARAAFLQQSGTTFLAARALGSSAWAAFFKVSLPLARPAIAGGVLLAVMETIADFGTVAYFGVQTFATGIYTSWFSMFDRAGAAQLALCLLSFALLLALLERIQRGRAKYHDPSRRSQAMPPIQLKGWGAAAAMIVCGIPVVFGAVLPIAVLLVMGLGSEQNLFSPRYLGFIQNSVTLAGIAAVVTVCAAISVGFFQRLRPGRLSNGSAYVARLGYAVPGGVIAVGLLVPFAAFDNVFDAWMRATFDISTGLLITGSIWLLIAAYLVRFLAAALGAYEGGQAMVHANMDAAARSLGQTPLGTLRRVHLPILAPSLLTALLIVFVDVMKELPATLIMRPFNYDTLAVQAYRLASDERLEGAAVPSLVIVAMGLLPVILICRQVGRKR